MENLKNTKEKINKLYQDLTYFDIYSGDLLVFIILLIILFVAYSYFTVMKNASEIKKNWNVNRCKPQNILFAGIINKPENDTIFEYTGKNFNFCVQNILTSLSSYAFQPFYYLYDSIINIFNEINEAIQAIRNIMANIRNNTKNIIEEIMGRLLNIITPIQTMFIAVKDIFGKVQGILTTGLMTALGAYFTLQTLMGSIIQFIILILTGLSVVVLALWLGFFTWPFAVVMTAVFVAISIPLSIIIVFMTQMLHIHTKSVPKVPKGKKPKCFDENTTITLKNNIVKKIKDLTLYDTLKDNSKITTIIKLDAKGEEMYNLNDIIVSGDHPVLYKDKWILVKNHPYSHPIKNYKNPYLYCINTTNKIIKINGLKFCDWDEIFNNLDKTNIILKKHNIKDFKDIHLYLDKGYHENVMITTNHFISKKIKNINIGDKLIGGEIVYGIVELKNISCLETNIKLYNLLTDKGTFKINSNIVLDYNNCMDNT